MIQYLTHQTYKTAKAKNPDMVDFQIMSRRQVEFAICIRLYRQKHELSLQQFANIASKYGVKISNADISCYERYVRVPLKKKMETILKAMHLELNDLD